jgi:hypothetical protein
MAQRAFTLCRKHGCSNIVRSPGFCAAHARMGSEIARKEFDVLNERKDPERKSFYASAAWTRTSLKHRTQEPLCRRCRTNGQIVGADMVHHNPPLRTLLAEHKNPFSEEYLESLCNNHHLEELRNRKKTKEVSNAI